MTAINFVITCEELQEQVQMNKNCKGGYMRK